MSTRGAAGNHKFATTFIRNMLFIMIFNNRTKNALLGIMLAIYSFFGMNGLALGHVEPDMPDAIAEMEYQILLDIKPADHEIRYLLGMVYFRQKNYDQAVAELQRVVAEAPDYPYAYTGLGQVKMVHQEYDAAIVYFRQAITILPSDNHVYYFLGQALEAKGNNSEAEQAYRTAIDNHKEMPAEEKKKKRYEKDLVMFQAALETLRSAGKTEN
jgi:tetratricopeptide (TPR) repeat protein